MATINHVVNEGDYKAGVIDTIPVLAIGPGLLLDKTLQEVHAQMRDMLISPLHEETSKAWIMRLLRHVVVLYGLGDSASAVDIAHCEFGVAVPSEPVAHCATIELSIAAAVDGHMHHVVVCFVELPRSVPQWVKSREAFYDAMRYWSNEPAAYGDGGAMRQRLNLGEAHLSKSNGRFMYVRHYSFKTGSSLPVQQDAPMVSGTMIVGQAIAFTEGPLQWRNVWVQPEWTPLKATTWAAADRELAELMPHVEDGTTIRDSTGQVFKWHPARNPAIYWTP